MTRRRARIAAERLEGRDTPATLDAFLTAQHADVSLGYAANDWNLSVIDQDAPATYTPDRALLYAGVNTLLARPAGSQFDFLGTAAGGDVYVLPQSQDPEQLFLGVAGYGIAAGALDRYDATTESKGRALGQAEWAKLRVVNVVGPGEFSMYQTGAFGDPVAAVSTYDDGVANPNADGLDVTDGLSADDAAYIIPGGHSHYNYAFTEPGRYEVTFRASGYLDNGNGATPGTPTATRDFTVYFSVANVGSFSLSPATVSVNEGAGTATVTVVRTGGSDGRLTVNYATSDGTAAAGSDYTAATGTLTFNDLETLKTFTIPITDDAAIEGNETVDITLSAPGPASIAGFAAGLPGGSLLGATATGTLTIFDNDDPDLPTITAIADRTTPEDTPVAVPFIIGDDDGIPGLTVTVASSNPTLVPNTAAALAVSPPNGSPLADRTLTITPAADQSGITTITVTVTDGGGAQTVETFTLTVTPVADAPTAVADAYGVTPGNALRGNVLLNDLAGPMGGPLTTAVVTPPTQGALALNPDGTFTYTPGGGFAGTDSLTYRVTGPDGSSVATVTISERPVDPGIPNVLNGTDIDVGIAFEGGALEPHIHDEVAGVEYAPEDGVFDVSALAATTQPAGAAFAFTGAAPGEPIWVLPETPIGGLLYLGIGAEEIDPANNEFVNDEVFLRVKAVDGPGHFSIWDGGATPTVLAATSEGVTAADSFAVPAGSHSHANWGFTARGLYAVTVQAYGTLDDGSGTVVVSPEVTYYFAVDPVNAAPVVTGPTTAQVFNDSTLPFTGPDAVAFTDAEASPGDYTAVVTATNGTVSLGGNSGASVTVTGTLAEVNAALAGLEYTPTAGFVGTATVTIDVTDPGYLVGAGNAATGTLTTTVTVDAVPDTTAPTVTISGPSSSATVGGPVTYTISYADENLGPVSLAATDVALNATGTAAGTVSVSGTGATRTVTISNITGDGTLGISLPAGTAADLAGNTAPAAGPSETFTVDNTTPAVTISPPSHSVTAGGPVTYTITYADANLGPVTLTAANVVLNATGTAAGTVSVSGTGATRTVTISNITGDGTLGISLPEGTASDLAGNAAPAVGPATPFTVDNTAPTVTISPPSRPTTTAGPIVYTVTFTDANLVGITLTAADVTLNRTGTADGTVSVSTDGGFTRTVTISGITGDGTLGISVAAGSAADPAGNPAPAAASGTPLRVDNTDLLVVGGSNGVVRILDTGGAVVRSFRPLDAAGSQYTGLLQVALGDFNRDGVADVFVAAANPAGVLGLDATKAGRVFVFDGATLAGGTPTLLREFVPFATHEGPGPNGTVDTTGAYVNGLNIAVGDVNGDGRVDLIAGTRGGSATAGLAEYGRLAVIDGTSPAGSVVLIGDVVRPFGPGYQKGVVVAAGDMDGDGWDEIGVTRGGPVAATNPNKTLKLKAYRLSGGALVELAFAGQSVGPLAPFAGITGPDGEVIARDARLAFTDRDGDGRSEMVLSALDPYTTTGNTLVRIAAFTLDPATGVAAAASTGAGPSGSYLVGANVFDHAIAMVDNAGTDSSSLALVLESTSSEVRYLDPLNGALLPGGFPLSVATGGVSINGL